MKKYAYFLRLGIAAIVFGLSVAVFTNAFYPLKIFDLQFMALLQRIFADFSLAALILLGLVVLMTLLFGRFYCSLLCPLGVFQELCGLVFRRKLNPQKHYFYKYLIAAVVLGLLVGGTAYILRFLDPYTISGSALSKTPLGLAVVAVIALLVLWKGRIFCADICPVGIILGLLAKHAYNKVYIDSDKCVSCGLCSKKCPTGSIDFKNKCVDNETCVKCLRCLNACHFNSLHYGHQSVKTPEPAFDVTRRNLLIGGAVLAFFAAAAKGGMDLSKALAQKLKKVILPAGAETPERFVNKCLNCNLCVVNCPMKIIKKADNNFPAIHLDYQNGFCDYNCHRCSEVCPSGAIKKLTLAQKQKTQIGVAVVNTDICVKCGLCARECPKQIIKKEKGQYPIISDEECIGCGTCQNVCPVQAITVTAVQKQKLL